MKKRDDEIEHLNRDLNDMLKKIFPDAEVKVKVFPAGEGIGIKIDLGSRPTRIDFDKLQEVLKQYTTPRAPSSNSQAAAQKLSDLEIIDAGDRYYITKEVDVDEEEVERIDIGREAVTIYKKNGSYIGFGLPRLESMDPLSLKYTLKRGILDIEIKKKI
ncbi:MAG: hypothetical protein QXJ68_06805 [Methanocellales archaeon]